MPQVSTPSKISDAVFGHGVYVAAARQSAVNQRKPACKLIGFLLQELPKKLITTISIGIIREDYDNYTNSRRKPVDSNNQTVSARALFG